MTKLLSNVDVVLGMDWLAKWNPVINWKRQTMHIWVNRRWDYINGVLLDDAQSAGTVKSIAGYEVSDNDVKKSDWVIMKQPKLWLSNADQKKKITCINTAQLTKDETTNSLKAVDTVSK